MKFSAMKHKNETDREYEMYSYLNAIDNENVEQFGLCNVYYYGDWKSEWHTEFKLVILTFLRGNLGRPARAGYFKSANGKNGLNTLILFRDFVSTFLPICDDPFQNGRQILKYTSIVYTHLFLCLKVRTSRYMHNHGKQHSTKIFIVL